MRLKLLRLAECAGRSQTRFSHAGANDCDVDHGPFNWGVFKIYVAEVSSARYTAFHLKAFLRELGHVTGAKRIHIIAHSMGNRALLEALSEIATEDNSSPAARSKFRQIILAAPDIDAGVFGELAKAFPTTAEHVTLYSNRNDKALMLSTILHNSASQGLVLPNLQSYKRI